MTIKEIREHCNNYGYSDGEVYAFKDGYQQGRADMKAEYESADIPIIHGKAELLEHDKQIRADAIDDAICEIQEAELMEAEKLIVISILEQLKNTDNCEVIEVKE